MATNATNPTRRRTARVIHWIFPSRQQVAISLTAEVGLTALGFRLWMHLALGMVLHLAIHLVGRLRRRGGPP
jgi:hypothetical protein